MSEHPEEPNKPAEPESLLPIDEHVEVALQAAGVGDIVGIEILNSRGWRP